MNNLKSRQWIPLLIAFALVTGCQRLGLDPIQLIHGESFFQDYWIVGEEVQIHCFLTFRNASAKDVRIRVEAWMPEDAENGLLKMTKLQGSTLDRSQTDFLIRADATASFEVLFVGNFAGTAQKQDRRLPEIRWEKIREGAQSGG